MRFSVTCTKNHRVYTEESFDELVELWDNDEVYSEEITLDDISVDVIDTYEDDEVVFCRDITTINEMRDLIETLDAIENLAGEDKNKLESIIEYIGLLGTNTVVGFYDDMDSYDYYDAWSLKDLAENFCEEGIYGDAVQEVYENNYYYLDMDYITDQLKYEYTETAYGVIGNN